jgi:hypothetical protein
MVVRRQHALALEQHAKAGDLVATLEGQRALPEKDPRLAPSPVVKARLISFVVLLGSRSDRQRSQHRRVARAVPMLRQQLLDDHGVRVHHKQIEKIVSRRAWR